MALADQMSFSANGDFGISDAGLCDYLLNDLDDDPASTDAIYAAVSATTSEHNNARAMVMFVAATAAGPAVARDDDDAGT